MEIKAWFTTLFFSFALQITAQPEIAIADTAAWRIVLDSAKMYQEAQDYGPAVDYARRAMQLAANWRHIYPDFYAQSANLLGGCLTIAGKIDEALPLLRDAEGVILEEGLTYTDTRMSNLSWLSLFYFYSNQFEALVGSAGELLDLCRTNPDWARIYESQALNFLAAAYIKLKKYAEAGEILEVTYQKLKAETSQDQYNLSAVISNLAYVYKLNGNYQKAFQLYREALATHAVQFGPNTDNYARMLNNLAKLYIVQDSLEAAVPLLIEALQILENTIGIQHEEYRIQLDNLALLYHKMGRYGEETACFAQILQGIQQTVVQQSGAFSESEQESLLKTTKYFIHRIHRKAAHFPQDSLIAGLSYDGSLLLKGLMLRNSQRLLSYLSRIDTGETKGQLQEWFRLRQAIYSAYLDPAAGRDRLDSLQRKANALESELAYRSEPAKYALPTIVWSDVQQALRPEEAAVEFSLVDVSPSENAPELMYMAYVIRPGWSSPRIVSLAKAALVDSIVQQPAVRGLRYAESIYNTSSGHTTALLYPLLWAPLDSLLAGVQTLYYSPEGIMHQLNPQAWATNATQRLADRHCMRRMSSTRLLAETDNRPAGPSNALIIGGVEYDMQETASPVALRSLPGEQDTERGASWTFLPHSEREAIEIKKLLALKGHAVKLLTGRDATEQAFKSLSEQAHSPRIIHLASHGYFAPETGKKAGGSRFTASAHPLIRSGLILAGANQAWNSDQLLTQKEDGVLTAFEISQCHFNNTELVVLSACNTGLGDIRDFEGVYGLQRAFKMAGVRYLIMSLWPAPDEPTRELMEAFYQHLTAGQSVPAAFQKAVDRQRQRYPHPYYWAGFVLLE